MKRPVRPAVVEDLRRGGTAPLGVMSCRTGVFRRCGRRSPRAWGWSWLTWKVLSLIGLALGLDASVTLLNRPRILVPPAYRALPGALGEWEEVTANKSADPKVDAPRRVRVWMKFQPLRADARVRIAGSGACCTVYDFASSLKIAGASLSDQASKPPLPGGLQVYQRIWLGLAAALIVGLFA